MRRVLWLALLLAAWPGRVERAGAQGRPLDNLGTGRIRGAVIDAGTFQPLGGVVVRLELIARAAAAPRGAITDSTGWYVFDGLRPGRYRVTAERIGYQPASVEVQLAERGAPQVGIGLQMAPVTLGELEIVGDRAQPYLRGRTPDLRVVSSRSSAVRMRQGEYLAADVRQVTQDEVLEAVTLAEPDLFRTLQRGPGVATRDDFTATVWTRGASWDQTRILFDGLPLFNPTHGGWLFSAVNADAVGEVAFLPGYRPARWGEGVAGVVSLGSRRGGAGGELSGAGEISPASVRLALDGSLADRKVRWMIAGRRTHVDVFTQLAERVFGSEDVAIPYDFSDAVGRLDIELPGRVELRLSGITEHDNLRGDIPGLVRGNDGRWGNRSGRVGLRVPVGCLVAEVSSGGTRFATVVRADRSAGAAYEEPTLPALRSTVSHDEVQVTVSPEREPQRWSVGYQWIRGAVSYRGPYAVLSSLVAPRPRGEREDTASSFLANRLDYSSVWGERRWRVGERLELISGLRADIGSEVENGGRVRLAPRLVGRWQLGEASALSAAWARTYQYTQDVAPAAGPVGPQLHLSAVWVMAAPAPTRPVARSDIRTLGLERWMGQDWLGIASVFHRRTTGLVVPNPTPGEVTGGRDASEVALNAAYGLELSLQRLAGPWTGSIGYSLGRSEMTTTPPLPEAGPDPITFAGPADVRHAVDVTGMVRVAPRVRFGGAFSYASGVPFTRLTLPDASRLGAEDPAEVYPLLGNPNAERTPSYASLDLMLDYTRTYGSWRISGYAQLRNVLGRRNSVTYLGSVDCRMPGTRALSAERLECAEGENEVLDRFHAGLPRLPLVGVRVEF